MSLFYIIQIFGSVGLLVVIAAIAAVGWGRGAKIADWRFAAERFGEDFPESETLSGTVSEDGKVALLEVQTGAQKAIGLVTVIGDKWSTRLLTPNQAKLEPCDRGLKVSLDDVTYPKRKILLAPDLAQKWLAAFKQITEPSHGTIA